MEYLSKISAMSRRDTQYCSMMGNFMPTNRPLVIKNKEKLLWLHAMGR